MGLANALHKGLRYKAEELGFTESEIYCMEEIMTKNPSKNLSYHNSTHCINVALSSVYLIEQENPIIDKSLLRIVFLAGLLHDFSHSGDANKPDRYNIQKAIEFVNFVGKYFTHSISSINLIHALIYVTEQNPQVHRSYSEILSDVGINMNNIDSKEFAIIANAISDSDYMEYFVNKDIFMSRVNDLCKETGNSQITFESSVNYLSNIEFKTVTGSKIAKDFLQSL